MFKRFSSGSFGLCFSVTVLLLAGCGGGSSGGGGGNFSIGLSKVELGKKIFFDESLSSQGNQSCASCHDPDHGFADGRVSETAPVSEGSETGAFGDRNAPTAAYASFTPEFGTLAAAGVVKTGDTPSTYRGGQFLDGRRSNLTEQAKDPFENPVEMNMPRAEVVATVRDGLYADDFLAIYPNAFDEFNNSNDPEEAYSKIADAIAAFEGGAELNAFSSKFDDYIRDKDGNPLSESEMRGLELFKNKAKCANCHTLDDSDGAVPSDSLFTNFEYHNVGTPKNPANPVYIETPAFIDLGLGGVRNETAENGKFRVPTLRNIDKTGPYMHNGVLSTLEKVIQHYDIDVANDFITPEVLDNIALELDVGLDLQPGEITDLIDFMKTLSDLP